MSPEPVASRLPVGENEAHNIGDECPDPTTTLTFIYAIQYATNVPESVAEHRVAGRTLKTDCGAQRTTRTSSSEKT